MDVEKQREIVRLWNRMRRVEGPLAEEIRIQILQCFAESERVPDARLDDRRAVIERLGVHPVGGRRISGSSLSAAAIATTSADIAAAQFGEVDSASVKIDGIAGRCMLRACSRACAVIQGCEVCPHEQRDVLHHPRPRAGQRRQGHAASRGARHLQPRRARTSIGSGDLARQAAIWPGCSAKRRLDSRSNACLQARPERMFANPSRACRETGQSETRDRRMMPDVARHHVGMAFRSRRIDG